MTSFVLPKKSYDFEKFSLESLSNTSQQTATSKTFGANLNNNNNNETTNQTRPIEPLNFHLDTLPIEELVESNDLPPQSANSTRRSQSNSTSSVAALIKPNNSNSELTSKRAEHHPKKNSAYLIKHTER